jgi:hypothetical protein
MGRNIFDLLILSLTLLSLLLNLVIVFICSQLILVFRLLDLELKLREYPFIFLEQLLNVVVIVVDNGKFVLKFFAFPLPVFKLIVKLLNFNLLLSDLFLEEVDIL